MSGFLTALAAVMNALFVIVGIYIYIALIRQIAVRSQTGPTIDGEGEKTFGLPDMVLAVALGTLFAMNVAVASQQSGEMVLRTQDLVANGLISVGLMLFVAAFLRIRGMSVTSLGGFSKLGFWRTLVTGAILLFASYPLIFLADLATRRFLGGDSSKQGIVEMFNESQTLQQRIFIIILAVAIAPIVEEFVFRFFLYGVVRRYLGRSIGLAANSILFAAVHGHAPSAVPLFVLGSCFTIAYEWSGSILVPMAMHALFNSLTLTFLAFPELFQQ